MRCPIPAELIDNAEIGLRSDWLDGRLRFNATYFDSHWSPATGILNARFVYEPAARNYAAELWGKNLTDELYVNGGFDTRDTGATTSRSSAGRARSA